MALYFLVALINASLILSLLKLLRGQVWLFLPYCNFSLLCGRTIKLFPLGLYRLLKLYFIFVWISADISFILDSAIYGDNSSLWHYELLFTLFPLATQTWAQKYTLWNLLQLKKYAHYDNFSAVPKRQSNSNSEQDVSKRLTLLSAKYGLVGVSILIAY